MIFVLLINKKEKKMENERIQDDIYLINGYDVSKFLQKDMNFNSCLIWANELA